MAASRQTGVASLGRRVSVFIFFSKVPKERSDNNKQASTNIYMYISNNSNYNMTINQLNERYFNLLPSFAALPFLLLFLMVASSLYPGQRLFIAIE